MTKMRQWTLLAAVAALAVLAGGWFLLVSPQRSKASDLKTQVTAQESTNQTLQNQLASLQAQHKDVPQVQAQLAKLGIQMPDNPALPTLIRQLSTAADDAGVDLVSLSPQTPAIVAQTSATTPTATVPAGGAAAPAAGAATGTSTGTVSPASIGQLASIGVTLHVNGDYFQIEQFLSNLEALKRSLLVSGITMAPGTKSGPADASTTTSTGSTGPGGYDGFLDANITGQVFMVAPPAPVAATVPTTTTTDASAAQSATTP